MPDPTALSTVPPGVDPTQWLQTQRQMQLAQALQGMALTPAQNDLQQPQGGGKYYQAARVRPFSALSKLAEAMMAKKGFDTTLPQMAQQYGQAQQAFAPGGQIQPTGQTAMTSGPQGDAAGPVPAPRTPVYAQTPQNPRNPQGLPPDVMLRLYQSDPAKYAAMVAGPENVQTGQFAGMDRQSAAQSVFNKQNAIDLRSGGMVRLPNGQMIRAPNLPPGYEPEFDAQGNLSGTHPSPGLIAGETAREGSVTAAKEQNTPRMIPQGGGVETLGYPPTPPALRQPPSNAPIGQTPQNKYFGAGPQTPPMPQAPPSARAPAASGPVKNPQTGVYDNNLWPSIPKMSIPNTPGSSSDSYTQGILGASVKKHQELVDEYGKGSAQAVLSNNYLDQALKHLPAAETGPMSEWLTENRGNLIETMPSLAPILGGTGSVTPTLELNKALVNSGLQGAKANFGRLTQSEVMLQKDEMSPSAKMTHDAIASLIHQQQIKNGYAIQQDKDYSDWHSQGGDPNKFESQYDVRRPMTRFAAQYDTPPAALERLKQQPNLLPAFVKKYNWDPSQ